MNLSSNLCGLWKEWDCYNGLGKEGDPVARERSGKSWWNRIMDRFTIQKKLLVTLVPVVLVTFLIFLLTVYFVSFRETQNIVNHQADTNVSQKVRLVDSYLETLRQETEIFMFDTNVQQRMEVAKASLSADDLDELEADFRRDMYSMIINYDVYVESISLKTVNQDYYVWKMDSRIPHTDFTNRLDGHEAAARELDGGMLFSYERLSDGVITVVRTVKDPIEDRELGLLMVDVSLDFLRDVSYPSSSWGRGEDPLLFIVNSENQVVFNSTPLEEERLQQVDQDTEQISVNGQLLRINHTRSSVSGWNLYLVINESVLYRNICFTTMVQCGIVLVSVILVVLVIWAVSSTISQQFRHFQWQISHTDDPQKQAFIQVDSQDEFRDLALVYNEMMGRIDNLIDTVYSKELLLKNAELKTLQAQINPHFLYNTLDCINSLVDQNRPEDTKKTVTALANLMRANIKGKRMLTVREEMEYINQYMYITKMRYGDKLLFLCEIPESMEEYYLPKLILQPLLENSVVHGISNVLGKGMIGLFGEEEEDSITFTVKDNGTGIPQDVIDSLEQEDTSFSEISQYDQKSIGLKNIQARVLLMYGNHYGLTIKNLDGKGSSVTVRLPKLTASDLETETERKKGEQP